jgi:hypothetical protein
VTVPIDNEFITWNNGILSSWDTNSTVSTGSVFYGIYQIEISYDNTTPCTPLWSCNGYDSCLINDTQNCNSVEDLNTCGDIYSGDYSEFTPQACNYCTSTWSNTNSSCDTRDLYNLTYAYTNTCCADTGLGSDCNIPANTTDGCNYCTLSESSHQTPCVLNLNTTYYTNDNYGSCCALTGFPIDCDVTANATQLCGINCTETWFSHTTSCVNHNQTLYYTDSHNCGTYLLLPMDNGTVSSCMVSGYVSQHSTLDIPAVVIDFFVKFGVETIAFIGLIVTVGVGLFIFKIIKV